MQNKMEQKNRTSTHEDVGSIPGLDQWFKGSPVAASCRWQMWLRSRLAVIPPVCPAVASASSCRSDLTPSLGTSMCHSYGPKKKDTHTHTHTHRKIVVVEVIHPMKFLILQILIWCKFYCLVVFICKSYIL